MSEAEPRRSLACVVENVACTVCGCVCDDLRLLHTAGMSITLRLYPCAHELSPQMLSDVDRWIIEQITAHKVSADRATA